MFIVLKRQNGIMLLIIHFGISVEEVTDSQLLIVIAILFEVLSAFEAQT